MPRQQSQEKKTGEKSDRAIKTEKDSTLNFPYPELQKENKRTEKEAKNEMTQEGIVNEEKPVTPKYKIVHRGFFEMSDYTGGRYV